MGFFIYTSMEVKIFEDNSNLPVRLEDLAQFVLIGRDKLTAVRAGIRALDKLDVAEGVRQQKREEAQMLAEALLDAEVRIGEILSAMPKAQGARNDLQLSSSAATKLDTKEDAIKKLGFDKFQVSRFQTLAANKDLVEQVKQEAREADDLPTRTAVLEAAKVRAFKEKQEAKITETVPVEDAKLIEEMKQGRTVVLNIDKHHHAVKYAKDANIYEQIDRWTHWGNPFTLGPDGDRDTVCDSYQIYFSRKFSLHEKLPNLKGKALGCHCHPLRCHGHHLKSLADETND
jgi:hypothetical protein